MKASSYAKFCNQLLGCILSAACLTGSLTIAIAGGPESRPEITTGHVLDLATRSARQAFGSASEAAPNKRFVKVEVARVVNPALIPVSFTIHWQPHRGERAYLGSFSLFPPDNPGTFIVSTRDELTPCGDIVVKMVPLQRVDPGTKLRVQLHDISLVNELD